MTWVDYANDALPDESFSFDANGNRTMAGYATGANNHRNRLVQVVNKDAMGTVTGTWRVVICTARRSI